MGVQGESYLILGYTWYFACSLMSIKEPLEQGMYNLVWRYTL